MSGRRGLRRRAVVSRWCCLQAGDLWRERGCETQTYRQPQWIGCKLAAMAGPFPMCLMCRSVPWTQFEPAGVRIGTSLLADSSSSSATTQLLKATGTYIIRRAQCLSTIEFNEYFICLNFLELLTERDSQPTADPSCWSDSSCANGF